MILNMKSANRVKKLKDSIPKIPQLKLILVLGS